MNKVKCRDCANVKRLNEYYSLCSIRNGGPYETGKERNCRWFENKEESQRLRIKLCLEGIDSALENLNEEIA